MSFRNISSEGLFDRGQVVNYFSVTHLKLMHFERGCRDYLLGWSPGSHDFGSKSRVNFQYDTSAHFILLKDLFIYFTSGRQLSIFSGSGEILS